MSTMLCKGEDVLSLIDWSREKIESVFKVAEKMEPIVRNREIVPILANKILAVVFYHPSTRTRTSFQSAMERLGGHVVGWESAYSSRARGKDVKGLEEESDKDTALMLNNYADAIALRHDHEGAAKEFAKWADIPVLNAGDGYGLTSEHPTQGLLDLYTIKKEQGKIDGLKVLHLGDAHSRTVHSLNFGLAKYDDIKVYICCPQEMRFMPEEENPLKQLSLDYEYVDDIKDVIKEVDVISGGGKEEKYILRASKLKGCKDNLIVMHPLPRGVGIAEDVDDTKYARYYQQAWNGVPIRMALLSLIFGNAPI